MATIEEYRSEFPHIAEGLVHLNHAGVSGMSTRMTRTVNDWVDRQSKNPSQFDWIIAQAIDMRLRWARLMGVPPEDLAVTKNTAHGVSIVADGLDWRPGDEVIFADCEYPANTYPWFAQQVDRGVICKIVPARPDGTIPVEDYAVTVTNRTRVIAVSWVQFATGYRADLATLTKLAHDNGALIVVDIIQALGAFPIDLSALGVDIAAVGSQKWLLGPMGVGGLYIHPNALAHLRIANVGATSAKNTFGFEPLNFDIKTTAQRYEEGTPNLMGCAALGAALEMLEEFGIENVSRRILATTRYAITGLEERGYIIDSPKDDAKRAGLLMFHHPTLPSEEIAKSLNAAKIFVVSRGGKVRFAPHFYNTEEDIDRAVAALP